MTMLRLTEKQIHIMTAITRHLELHGYDIDIDQLLDSLPYKTTKESLQFSLRALIKKNVLTKVDDKVIRRGRARRTYQITPLGKSLFKTQTPVSEDISKTA